MIRHMNFTSSFSLNFFAGGCQLLRHALVMATGLLQDRIPGGFSFENCYRNQRLEKSGLALPKATKTGTTICGVVFKDGVVLGADTRATSGNIVAEKNCEKIHYISDNIYCCGAGTAADTEMTTKMISSKVELHRLNSGRQPRVILPLRLLKDYLFGYRGYVGAALILGGVDYSGPHLYSVAPHGSSDKLPYVTMGSGSLAAMSVLESRFRFDMDVSWILLNLPFYDVLDSFYV
ncbi:hypothetical protein AHF37_10524 [Paragonimus kellicotti]|nr:hypothetical protein AHF37_10524 [Paragonimus kellicotti]